MIEKANARAKDMGMEDKLEFHVGDAYNLDFPDHRFDIVLTVFVSQFLDLNRAFSEFKRVVKPGGYLGINEMYRDDSVPQKYVSKVDEGETIFRELTGLPFKLRSPSEWVTGFREASFNDVIVEQFQNYVSTQRGLDMIGEMGGWGYLFERLWHILVLGIKSSKMRKKFGDISKGKRVLINDKITSKYIGYVLGVGRKI
jgi:ubiquinone/menaquinone biosynthesis C-methylase UbiE